MQHTGVTGSAREPKKPLSGMQFSLGLGEGLSQLAFALGRSSSKCLCRCALTSNTGVLSSSTKTKKAFFHLRIPAQTLSYVKVLPSFTVFKLRVGVCALGQNKSGGPDEKAPGEI